MKEKLYYAKDMRCCVEGCKKKSVCFWPMIDPDIPHHPYCRKHVDEAKEKVLMAMWENDIKI